RLSVRDLRCAASGALQRADRLGRPPLLHRPPHARGRRGGRGERRGPPAAAGVVASSVVLLGEEPPQRWEQIALAVAAGVLALLMVSTFRYWSFKEVDFLRRRPVQSLLVVVLSIMIVATKHDVFLFALFTGYAVSGPVRRVLVGRTLSAPA